MPTAASAPPRRVVLATHRKHPCGPPCISDWARLPPTVLCSHGQVQPIYTLELQTGGANGPKQQLQVRLLAPCSSCLGRFGPHLLCAVIMCDDRHVSNHPALQPLQPTLQPLQPTLQPLQCSRRCSRCCAAVAAVWIGSHLWAHCPTRPQVDYPNLSKMCTDLEAAIKVWASRVRAARTLSSSAGDC